MKDNNVIENNSQFLIWHDNVHGVNVNVILHDDNIWLTAKQMSEIFITTRRNIDLHIDNIYYENELDKNSTKKDYFLVQKEGKRISIN